MESSINFNLPPRFSKGSDIARYGLSYLDTIYFIVVTMSTVGYGDVTPLTLLGKLTMIIFIFVGIVRDCYFILLCNFSKET
jgi:voltage-gated potassium channel Kch